MKHEILIAAVLFLAFGCSGGDGGKKVSEQQVSKLESKVQMLQQSVEAQDKTITALRTELRILKTQISEANLDSIGDLKNRVDNLETVTSGYEK